MLSQDNQVSPAKLNREALTEALYIRSTQYVLQIPENFEKDFSSEDVTLQVTAVPGSRCGVLSEQSDRFLFKPDPRLAGRRLFPWKRR